MFVTKFPRWSTLLACGGMIIAILAIAPTADAQSEAAAPVTVTFVSRGDILRIQQGAQEQVVMLYGVTCPEMDTPIGAQAKRFTENFIAENTLSMTVRFRQPQVNYVEISAADGRILNHALLLAGLGKRDTLTAAADDAYAALEENARSQQAGLWQPSDAGVPGEVLPIDEGENPLDRFKRLKRLAEDAAFAVEYDHWRRLTNEQRTEVRTALRSRASARSEQAVARLDSATTELDAIEKELDSLESELERTEQALEDSTVDEEDAVQFLYEDDPDLRRLEERLNDARAATSIALRDYGGGSAVYFRQLEEERISEELVVQRRVALEGEEIAIREDFAEQRRQLSDQIAALTKSLNEKDREYNRYHSEHQRAAGAANAQTTEVEYALTGVEDLDAAVTENYESPLKRTPIGDWRGRGNSETPPFDVKQDVWVLDYDAGADAGNRQLKAIVRRESDDRIVSQIVDLALPHQSFVVLKEPGGYYIEVRAPETLEWTLSITGFAAP